MRALRNREGEMLGEHENEGAQCPGDDCSWERKTPTDQFSVMRVAKGLWRTGVPMSQSYTARRA